MTARRCRADGTSGRRPLRAVQRTCPVGRDPCVPPLCSCHSEFVGADDSVRPRTLAWESAFPKREADCRVASLLAMTPQGKIPIPGTRTAEDSGPYGRFSGNHPIPLRQGTRALPYRIFYRHTSCRAGAHVLRRLSTPKCGKAPGRAKALPGVLVSSGQESSSWPVHSW